MLDSGITRVDEGGSTTVAPPGAPRVVATLVNWNQPDYTIRCVESLRRSDYPNLHIIVLDNGSAPDVYARVSAAVGPDELIRSDVNLGFGRGANRAIRHALAQGADYVLAINNDTIAGRDMVSRLVQVAEARPDAGLIAPLIYYAHRPDRVWLKGYRSLGAQGLVRYALRRGLPRVSPHRRVQEVDFVSGCCVLIPRAVLDGVGLFADQYFMYYEDVDLCLRIRRSGRVFLCVADARLWHVVAGSSGGEDSLEKLAQQLRSALVFHRTHSRGLTRALYVSLRCARAGLVLGRAMLSGRIGIASAAAFVARLWRGGG